MVLWHMEKVEKRFKEMKTLVYFSINMEVVKVNLFFKLKIKI